MKLRLHRGDQMLVFLAHKNKGSLVAPTIVLSEYDCLFY
jgi:hypothetical protein